VIHFVLLAHVRSGSTMLVRSLAEHHGVRMFGELFNPDENERARAYSQIRRDRIARRRGLTPQMYYHDGEDGADFLANNVFYKRFYEGWISSVGFKLFYEQARDTLNAKKAWTYLFESPELRVIHLFRFNLLETYLSYRIAKLTDEWALLRGDASKRKDVPPLRLEPEDCAAFFDEMIANREWARKAWKNHSVLELNYENDLCNGYDATLARVEDFIEVDHEPAEQRLVKQARRQPHEQISNYDELKEYFRYSVHEAYFNNTQSRAHG